MTTADAIRYAVQRRWGDDAFTPREQAVVAALAEAAETSMDLDLWAKIFTKMGLDLWAEILADAAGEMGWAHGGRPNGDEANDDA
jgi:hypothetical protein